MTIEEVRERLKQLFSDYQDADGCGCCVDFEKQSAIATEIDELLSLDLCQ